MISAFFCFTAISTFVLRYNKSFFKNKANIKLMTHALNLTVIK